MNLGIIRLERKKQLKIEAKSRQNKGTKLETRACVTETVLTSAKLPKVSGGLGDNVIVELELDTASWLVVD